MDKGACPNGVHYSEVPMYCLSTNTAIDSRDMQLYFMYTSDHTSCHKHSFSLLQDRWYCNCIKDSEASNTHSSTNITKSARYSVHTHVVLSSAAVEDTLHTPTRMQSTVHRDRQTSVFLHYPPLIQLPNLQQITIHH